MSDLWAGILASILITIITLIFSWHTERSKRLLIVHKRISQKEIYRVLITNLGKEAILMTDLAKDIRLEGATKILFTKSNNILNDLSVTEEFKLKFKFLNPKDSFFVEYESNSIDSIKHNEIINGSISIVDLNNKNLSRIMFFIESFLFLSMILLFMPIATVITDVYLLYLFINDTELFASLYPPDNELLGTLKAHFIIFMITIFPLIISFSLYPYWVEFLRNGVFYLRVPKNLVKLFNKGVSSQKHESDNVV